MREGGTHRAERRERGREGKARAAGPGPRWWEDGRRGREAGLPVPSAAADFWKGRRRRAGLGAARSSWGGEGCAQCPETLSGWRGEGGICTITTLDPELGLGGLLPQQLLASPSRPQTVLFADAAPRGEGAGKEGSSPLSCLSCSVVASRGDTLGGNGRSSGGVIQDCSGGSFLPCPTG